MSRSGSIQVSVIVNRKILLIDDDILFSKILEKVAKQGGIELTVVNRLQNWDWMSYQTFDALIIDYDLGNITGPQLVRTVQELFRPIPAILVSSYKKPVVRNYPSSLIHFLHKSEGPQRILMAALYAHDDQKNYSRHRAL